MAEKKKNSSTVILFLCFGSALSVHLEEFSLDRNFTQQPLLRPSYFCVSNCKYSVTLWYTFIASSAYANSLSSSIYSEDEMGDFFYAIQFPR